MYILSQKLRFRLFYFGSLQYMPGTIAKKKIPEKLPILHILERLNLKKTLPGLFCQEGDVRVPELQ